MVQAAAKRLSCRASTSGGNSFRPGVETAAVATGLNRCFKVTGLTTSGRLPPKARADRTVANCASSVSMIERWSLAWTCGFTDQKRKSASFSASRPRACSPCRSRLGAANNLRFITLEIVKKPVYSAPIASLSPFDPGGSPCRSSTAFLPLSSCCWAS